MPACFCRTGTDDNEIPIVLGQGIALRSSDVRSDRLAVSNNAPDQFCRALVIGRNARQPLFVQHVLCPKECGMTIGSASCAKVNPDDGNGTDDGVRLTSRAAIRAKRMNRLLRGKSAQNPPPGKKGVTPTMRERPFDQSQEHAN